MRVTKGGKTTLCLCKTDVNCKNLKNHMIIAKLLILIRNEFVPREFCLVCFFLQKVTLLQDSKNAGRHVFAKIHRRKRHGFEQNHLTVDAGGFRYRRGFSPRCFPRFAVTSTTKSLLTQPLYGGERNPLPSEPPKLAPGDPFLGLNDYDTGVMPGSYSGWNSLTDRSGA